MLKYLVFVGAAISVYAQIIYVREMFRGNAQPNKVSWFLWALAPLIGSIAAFSQGVVWATIPTFEAALSSLLVFVFSFIVKGSYWEVRTFDIVCGLISVLALIIWYFTKDANLAISFSIVSDAFASIPTAIKAWLHPETEVAWPFFAGIFSATTSFFAVSSWKFASVAFPAYLWLVNLVLALIILRQYRKKKSYEK